MRAASLIVLAAISASFASPVLADPGHGHGNGPWSDGPGQSSPQVNIVISPNDRTTVNNYYRTEYVAGHCPPGLAKKNNGCLPPGQAKKLWAIGQPLPWGVAYYPLPAMLLGQLSPAPMGYQYVRVADDILLMAVATRMIAGALADLGSF